MKNKDMDISEKPSKIKNIITLKNIFAELIQNKQKL